MSLTNLKISQAKPAEKDYKLADERGLYLLVTTKGYKYWRMKYRFAGKEKKLSFGSYPAVTLKAARARCMEARLALAEGQDPGAKVATSVAFSAVAEKWFAKTQVKWSDSHRERVASILHKELFPSLGQIGIADLHPHHLLSALQRIEDREAFETARKTRRIAGQVFRYGIANNLCQVDIAAPLRDALSTTVPKHAAAVTTAKDLRRLLLAIDTYHGSAVVCAALKISALLFQRPGEIRHMEWAEIQWNEARWELPAEKMKMRTAHIVPLSRQALSTLDALQKLTGRGQYVFPSLRGDGRPMSENAVRVALRSMGFDNNTMTAHGFRATARTLLDEVLGYRTELIEHQLAHAVRDATGRAYNRTTHLPARTEMMQRWADYLDELVTGPRTPDR